MESYYRKFFVGHLLALLIVACTIIYFGKSEAIAILLFVSLMECLFFYLDIKYLPQRRAEIASKLNKIFKAKEVKGGVMKFKINAFDLFAKVEIDLKQNLQFANAEAISFYVPEHQMDHLSPKPGFTFVKDNIEGEQTYRVYQTDGKGLEEAKEKLKSML